MDLVNQRKQRIEDIKGVLQQLLDNADKIGDLVCLYEYHEELDAKGIYHSCVGNMMKHFGMLNFLSSALDNKMAHGEYNYCGDKVDYKDDD